MDSYDSRKSPEAPEKIKVGLAVAGDEPWELSPPAAEGLSEGLWSKVSRVSAIRTQILLYRKRLELRKVLPKVIDKEKRTHLYFYCQLDTHDIAKGKLQKGLISLKQCHMPGPDGILKLSPGESFLFLLTTAFSYAVIS